MTDGDYQAMQARALARVQRQHGLTSQLDELERKARELIEAPAEFHATASGTEDERTAERRWRRAEEAFREAATPSAMLQLIAVTRAALAWRDARTARQEVGTRASLAETSAEHGAAMQQLPAAKEAEVVATLTLLSALEEAAR